MDVFRKHFSLTTLENKWMWYKRAQKVLEVLDQYCCHYLVFSHSLQIFVDFVRFTWTLNFIFVRSQGVSCCHIWRSKESSWNDIRWTQCRNTSSSGIKLLKLAKKVSKFPAWLWWMKSFVLHVLKIYFFFHFVPLFQTSSDGNCSKDSKKKKIKLGWMKTWQLKQNINYLILISIRMTVVLFWSSD